MGLTNGTMSEEGSELSPFEEEKLEILKEYATEILNRTEEIERVFDQTIDTDLRFNELDTTLKAISGVFHESVDPSDQMELSEAILNVVANFSPNIADKLIEAGGECQRLSDFFHKLEASYSVILSRRINRYYKGNDWWSNISTDMGYRNRSPILRHEITKDYDEQTVITSDPQNSLVFALHIIRHVNSARDNLGEDILDYISEETVNEIEEVGSELSEAIENYPTSSDGPDVEAVSVDESDQ